MSEKERERAIVENAAEREGKYRTGPSSQDVWRQREFLVSGAFERNLEEVERGYGDGNVVGSEVKFTR